MLYLLPQVKEKYRQNILYDAHMMYISTFRTGFSSLGALRIELFGGQFHIADSSSFSFFKGCKIIGIITKVPLYSIKVTGGVPGLYQLWGEMFGS